MKKIYVYCPGNVLSGGIYSLHNLCAKLAEAGYQAGMLYHSIDPDILNHEHIRAYHVSSFISIEDSSDNILIVSETETLFLHRFIHIQKVVYWLGLNNYFNKPVFRRPFHIKLLRKAIMCRNYYGYAAGIIENCKRRLSWWSKAGDIIWRDPVIHMSNSYYVAQCCHWRGVEKVNILHNPVQEEYYHEAGQPVLKKPKIIFGPKTPKILIALCRCWFNFEIVRLKHLSPDVVKQHMKEAMVFAEFGNNSGRDRMPREAALLGCVVFSNTRGSAAFNQDMPIPDRYKIPDTLLNYRKIMRRLKQSVRHYASVKSDFNDYLSALEEERTNFPAAVKRVFAEILQ
jgi:glycosyltransferase involved in cell wall biosynthesis